MATTRYCSGVERIPEHIPWLFSYRFADVREIFGIVVELSAFLSTFLWLFSRVFVQIRWCSRDLRHCSGVERTPEHIPVIIFVSCSLMFARFSVFPRQEICCM